MRGGRPVAVGHRVRFQGGTSVCGQARGGRLLLGFEVGGEVASEYFDPAWLAIGAGVGEAGGGRLAELVEFDAEVQGAPAAD